MIKNKKKMIIILSIISIILFIYLFYGLPWERKSAETLAAEILQSRYYAEYIITGDHYYFWSRSYKISAAPKYTSSEWATEQTMVIEFGWGNGKYGIIGAKFK